MNRRTVHRHSLDRRKQPGARSRLGAWLICAIIGLVVWGVFIWGVIEVVLWVKSQ